MGIYYKIICFIFGHRYLIHVRVANNLTIMSKKVTFRFYEELNDFLPDEKKKTSFSHDFEGSPSIKDAIKVYDSQYRNRYIVYADNKRERHICFIFNVNNAGEAIEKFLKEKNVNREYFNNISCTLDNEK